MKKPIPPAQLRELLKRRGIPVEQYARDLKLPDAAKVRALLNGRELGVRGKGHNYAVVLGIKEGELTPDFAAQYNGRQAA